MYEVPSTLPEPTSTRVRNGKNWAGVMQRDVTTTWVLNPEQEGVPSIRVTLTTYHFAESKVYGTAMSWATFEPAKGNSAFSVESWSSDNARKQIGRVPVARHSLKAMEEAHAQALTAVEQRFSHVAWIFEEAASKSGLMSPVEA